MWSLYMAAAASALLLCGSCGRPIFFPAAIATFRPVWHRSMIRFLLREDGHHLHHHLPSWCCRVDVVLKGYQADALLSEVIDHGQQLPNGTTKPVQLIHHQRVTLPDEGQQLSPSRRTPSRCRSSHTLPCSEPLSACRGSGQSSILVRSLFSYQL